MKRLLIALTVLAVTAALWVLALSAVALADTEVFTPNLLAYSTWDMTARVSGDRVVWYSDDSGGDLEIYTWTPAGGVVQLTNNSESDMYPVVSGNRVAWCGWTAGGTGQEIFTWTPTGGIVQITNNTTNDGAPVISGDRIVWQGPGGSDAGSDNEIFTWTPTGGVVQITHNDTEDIMPQVSGDRIVWEGTGGTDAGTDYEIFTWTASGGTTQLTTNTLADGDPNVAGDRVVWDGVGGSDGGSDSEMFTWTPTGGTVQLTANDLSDGLPLISGTRVVWSTYDPITSNHLSTWTPAGGTVQIPNSACTADGLDGDRIVWTGGGWVYTWTPTFGTAPVTTSGNSENNVSVSGSRVAWEGSNRAIYTATAVPVYTPTISSLSPSTGPGSGGTSVVIHGTNFVGLSGANAVTFGGINATSYTVNSATQITAVAPAHVFGTYQVQVTTASGVTPDTATDDYTYTSSSGTPTLSVTRLASAGNASSLDLFSSPTNGAPDLITWLEDAGASSKIYDWNGANGQITKLQSRSTNDSAPQASANRVVWVGNDGTDTEIYTCDDNSSPTQVTSDSYPDNAPRVSENKRIVWVGQDASGWGVFTGPYAEGVTPISDCDSTSNVAVSGDRIAWTMNVAADGKVWVYTWTKLGGVTALANTGNAASPPAVSGNRIAWLGSSGGNVYTWTLGGGIVQVASGASTTVPVRVSGDRLAWVDAASKQVFTWTPGGGVVAISSTSSYLDHVDVSGDRVIWTDSNLDRLYTWTPAGGAETVANNVADSVAPRVANDRLAWVQVEDGSKSMVYTAVPQQVITGVSPNLGSTLGGNPVVISGSGFRSVFNVYFGVTTAETFSLDSSHQISAYAPPGSAGTVRVKVVGLGGDTTPDTPADDYTYVTGSTIVGLSPAQGMTSSSTTVVITGTALIGATSVNFGSTPASSFTVDSATQITAVAPPHAAGTVRVTVTAPAGTTPDSSADDFTWVTPNRYQETDGRIAYTGTWGPYSSTSASGAAYTRSATASSTATIYFNGTQLDWIAMKGTTTGRGNVYLDGAFKGTVDLTAGAPSYQVDVWSTGALPDNTHKVVIAWDGPLPGKYVTLDAVDILGTITAAPPWITSITPNSGLPGGGTSVVIKGTGFDGVSGPDGVLFSSTPAASYTVNSSTQITAITPAHALGDTHVSVTANGWPSANNLTFKYTAPTTPTVTAVSPASGTINGGTSVTITGTDFTGATAVTFAGAASPSFHVDSVTQITAVTPAHAAGITDVQVTTPLGTSTTTLHDYFTFTTVAPATLIDVTTAKAGVTFSSGWANYTSSSAYGGSYARTNTANAYAVIAFKGTQLDWVTTKGTTTGVGDVYVDGAVTPATISLVASSAVYQQDVWGTGPLPDGYHTVKIQRSTSSASGRYLTLDAVLVAGTLAPAVRKEESESLLVWSLAPAPWTLGSTTSASGGAYRYSNASGATLTINFRGVSLNLLAKTAASYGNMLVSLDGGPAKSVSLYSSSTAYKKTVWKSGFLIPGNHTVVITRAGLKSSSSSGYTIDFDAIDLIGDLR